MEFLSFRDDNTPNKLTIRNFPLPIYRNPFLPFGIIFLISPGSRLKVMHPVLNLLNDIGLLNRPAEPANKFVIRI